LLPSLDYQLFRERTGTASTIVTSNRDTSEWLVMVDDRLLAQTAVDRFRELGVLEPTVT